MKTSKVFFMRSDDGRVDSAIGKAQLYGSSQLSPEHSNYVKRSEGALIMQAT